MGYFLLSVLLCGIINTVVVSGDYLFVVGFNSVTNPTNRVFDNSCCICCEVEGVCNDTCDISLRVCLRPAGFSHSDPSCPLLELYGDARPRSSHLAIDGTWLGSIQLYIRVTHNVGAPDKQQELINDVLIDELYIEISNLTSFSPRTLAEYFVGDGGRVEAELQFEVNCETNYYGPYCDVECHGRDDTEGHYLCNSSGELECLEGYQNLETNCTECIAPDGCVNGYCDGPLNCVCMDGWAGELCMECVPSVNCSPSGGYCLNPGDCLCSDGYSGENCSTINSTITSELSRIKTVLPLSSASSSFQLVLSTPVTLTSTINPTTRSTSESSTTTATTIIILPTVGGVFPSTSQKENTYLLITVVASVGGLLLLIMLLVSIVALCVASWHRGITGRRKRGLLNGRRVYEIPTSVPDAHLNGNAHNDDNHLLGSTSPTSYQNDANVTCTTFRNIQPLQRELHVYYHHNTPEPPSARQREEEEVEEMEADDGEGMTSVEMEFPSGYTDPWPDEAFESYLQ